MKSVYGCLFGCFWIVLLEMGGTIQARPFLTFSSVGDAVDSNSRWLSESSIELNGSGLGFSDSGDNVIFAWGTASGNFDAALHVAYITDTSSNSETGLMARVDTTEGAPFCALMILQEKGIVCRYRTETNGAVSTIVLSRNIHTWLRIKRSGNNIRLFSKSTSGAVWKNIASYQLSFPSALLTGTVHMSHSDSIHSAAVIDSFSGFTEEPQSPPSCVPVLYDFEDTVSLAAQGFRSITNWEKDSAGFIKAVLPSSPVCSAFIQTPQFLTHLGTENITVSWDLHLAGDSMPYLYDYGIFSLQTMQLGDRVKVSGNRIGSASGIEIGINDTISGDVFSIGNTLHRERSRVNGNVKVTGACSLMVGATVTGTILQSASIILPTIAVRSVSPGTDSIIVYPNDSINLSPGHYRALHAYANSKVRLSPGEYHFRSFVTEPEVKIYCAVDNSNCVDVNIEHNLQFADRTVMQLSDSTVWNHVKFYSGQDSTMDMGADVVLKGYFSLPFAEVRIVSRSCVITGGLYAEKIKCEPDIKLTVNTIIDDTANNELEVCLIDENRNQSQQSFLYTIHRSDYSDSCTDFLFRNSSDTLFSYASNEKTPIGRDLHFEYTIYPTGETCLLYNNGLYLRQIFDSIPFALTNLTALTFRYIRNDITLPVTPRLDNILISCSQDTCSPLILLRNPADTTVYEHSTVVFRCEVLSRGAVPVYQWYRDSVAVPWANQSVYSIAHTALSDSGAVFSCRISNGCSEATSATAVLSVWECTEPLISDQPDDDTVMLGNPATFSVVAQGLGLEYQWLCNDTVIENAIGADYAIHTTHVYNNYDVYKVRVTNGCGSWTLSNPARLVITDVNPCKIIQHPLGDTLMEGETYQTEVQVICQNSNFTWFKNGAMLPGYTTGTCVYGPVTPADNNAQFFCIVDNGVTVDTSRTAVLYVRSINDKRQCISIAGELYNGIGKQMGNKEPELFDFRTMLFTGKTGGNALYTEQHKGVSVKEGEFTIVLGHGRSDKDLQSIVACYRELYAEIHAGKNGTFEQIAPRLRLTAAPYAFTSGVNVVHGYGNPDSTSVSAPLGTMYVDEADSNRTWKLGSEGWGRLD
ncbi:MAG TPA: immunoglobulin domain-containing protein [Chitinispirillaceae bacterium]|nr:immunoglobulin domain-containing protein [Chitinispirillaceae bacterium]